MAAIVCVTHQSARIAFGRSQLAGDLRGYLRSYLRGYLRGYMRLDRHWIQGGCCFAIQHFAVDTLAGYTAVRPARRALLMGWDIDRCVSVGLRRIEPGVLPTGEQLLKNVVVHGEQLAVVLVELLTLHGQVADLLPMLLQ